MRLGRGMFRPFALVIAFAVIATNSEEVVLNGIVDVLLEAIEEELSHGGIDKMIKMPSLAKRWSKDLGLMEVSAEVNCTDGKLDSIGSIKRSGDVTFKKEGASVTVRANLYMEEINISYNKCKAKVAGISSSNPLKVTASHVSLVVQVTMARTASNCTNDLDYLVIKDLGKISASMGSGAMANIKEVLIEYFATRFHNMIVNSVNHRLESAATKALIKKKDFCTKLFFLVKNPR